MIFKKKLKKHVLPLEDVQIGAWPEQNFLLGMLLTQKSGYDWVMNQFIQLRGAHYINYQLENVDYSITFYPYAIHQLTPNLFDLCPFVQKYTLPKSFVKCNYGKFHEFVQLSINNGYYVSTFLDQFFRNDMGGNYGFHHPTFIYGYDDVERKVYLADNFEMGKYGKKQITFEQLERAFHLVPGDAWEVSVFLYKCVSYQYTFYVPYIREQIADYLNPQTGICYLDRTVCQNHSYQGKDYANEVYFGVECYQLIHKYLESVLWNCPEYPQKDWRSFVMLCDHKYLMLKRYEYMTQKGYLLEEPELKKALVILERHCRIALNMFIKYSITEDKFIIKSLMQKMQEIYKIDVQCMKWFSKNVREEY